MKNTEKAGTFGLGMLWFGAAVSISEILTGALLAPLGFAKGLLAILIGHAVGCAILWGAGYIGAKGNLSAIESTRISFGKYGSYLFSVLNVIQLLGWTAVMIINGAKAMDAATPFLHSETVWSLVIGGLIAVWILVGIKNLSKVSTVAVGALFLLTLLLGWTVFRGGVSNTVPVDSASMPFGAAVELSVTMPLSWLPLISDYTRTAEHPQRGTAVSALCYTAGSSIMYVIGLGAALYTGSDDIAAILVSAGLGMAALLIVLLSTVTTTFLDAWSGGVSLANLNSKISEKWSALLICIVGAVLAVVMDINQYENFLYFIGSVFAPLFAVLMTDYFLLHITQVRQDQRLNGRNLAVWAVGFVLYRLLMRIDCPLGTSLPTMIAVALLCLAVHGIVHVFSQQKAPLK
ncbi:MAG: putative hydroxymethylpyrimidine transporter CytX [Oscillospiraceae bacterium]|nr:putative hydroxymethylpyrimidine transporter CytX [Oscillospiraceae bacterium]